MDKLCIASLLLAASPLWAQQNPISTTAGDGILPPGATVGRGVVTDGVGNLYFSDIASHRIWKRSPSGMITAFAGNGSGGYSGDGGPATSAQLRSPWGMAVDADGNLYIGDDQDSRVRKVAPDGIITTIAGNGTNGYSGDGGPATNAQLWGPVRVAVDTAGDVYIADSANSRIRKVSPSGIISTIAGTGGYAYSGDGGPAVNAQFQWPSGVAVDRDGNVYVVDDGCIFFDNCSNRIRKISTNGVITTFAGNGPGGYSGDGGPAVNAQLGFDFEGVAVDRAGNVYIADTSNHRIRRVSPDGIITTIAGNGIGGYSGDGGQAIRAQLNGPADVFVDSAGNLYIADLGNVRIRKVFPDGIITTVVGSPALPFTYSGQAVSASGGSGSVSLTFPPGFAWTASSTANWIMFTGPVSGTGSGTLNYQVVPNAAAERSATITVAGFSFTIEQQAASISGLSLIGSMPHIAAEENWNTTFTLVNKGAASAQARMSFFGDPSGTLTLPLGFPQLPHSPLPLLAASFDRALAAHASLIIDTAGPQTPPVLVGSAQLGATGPVDGFAIFHLIPGAQEVVVPLETRNASSYLLAFDNTGGVVLGIAVENVSAQAANIPVVIRDDNGVQIGAPVATIALAGNGHTSFVLSIRYPVTANKRGTIEFDTPAGGQISVLGIRTTPIGSSTTLASIPALADIGTNGGSIAHIATGNGWQTTFVLVNAGTNTAQAHLKFFADNGGALFLPLGFPQSGGGTSTVASTVDRTLPAGATLIVQTTAPLADPAPIIGSAQFTTDGNVGGFVIFRYNLYGQEAVVPFENRSASGYLLAFDNTAGAATGIAINSVSAQAANIPVVIRDDTGTQIATDMLNLAANGHLAFTLVTDKYPATANIRGTIEFDTPPGGQIGALGIRIPLAHTLTTLPALAK